ncbi:MAG: MBL fold metallo-hydrolase [Candidatus Saccharibacteria bacterium]|nr:MBL fold metallo-hydrolase [Candidatus Saccharibacteria bacterium]
MIEIEYFGGNSLKITSNKQSLVINPKRAMFGLKDLNVNQSVEIVTSNQYIVDNNDGLLIDGPGEYEVQGFSINGIAVNNYQDSEQNLRSENIYGINIEEIRIAVLGNIKAKLNDDQLEAIGMVDVLIIPVGGGGYTLYGKEAAFLTKQISPKIVIPVHYADGSINYEVPQDTDEEFKNELNVELENKDKLSIKKAVDLPEHLKIVKLARK